MILKEIVKKNKKLNSFFYKNLMTFRKYSILRILQIEELKKQNIVGSILDVGGKETPNNTSNFLNAKIKYLDKYSKNENDLKIDLEKKFLEDEKNLEQFDNVLLMNVLEHIYDYKNCINICYKLTKKNGRFIGSTPFFFRIHPSPNDYFRYTKEALERMIRDIGFKEVKVYPLAGGIFISFYSNIFLITNKIPFLNNLLLFIFSFLDKFLYLFTKSYKNIMPIGYFFTAIK